MATVAPKPLASESLRCMTSFRHFVHEFWGEIPGTAPLCWNWHLDVICEELQRIAMRVYQGLPNIHDTIINVSPGTSKSSLCSILFQAWVWTFFPKARHLTASHTDTLCLDLANKSRTVIRSEKYRELFPHVRLAPGQNAKGYYQNTHGGDRLTCTVAGKSPMGFHAHYLLCFPGDTLIATNRGQLPIGEVVESRLPVKVLGYDHVASRTVWRDIEEYERSPGRQLVTITFGDGRQLEATSDHPVYAIGRGYVEAATLNPGDMAIEADDTGTTGDITVVSVGRSHRRPRTVYNVRIADVHNYFANGVLVHNCDDPLDPKKAVSEAELYSAQYFFDAVLPSRKVDKAVSTSFLVMQRLHDDDPTGHLLKRTRRPGTTPIRRVCLPAELTAEVHPPELAGRYRDGLMDPVRLSRSVLQEARANMGEYAYAGQYLQRPVPLTGGLFREAYFLLRAKAAPLDSMRVRFWDRACLIAGTMVSTAEGLKPIQEVRQGDLVLTRCGYRPVVWSGPTKAVTELVRVHFANGSTVVGTPDHPVWTENVGWIPLAFLNSSHYVKCTTEEEETWAGQGIRARNLSFSAVSTIPATQDAGTIRRCDGIQSPDDPAVRCSIGRSGSTTMGKFLPATTSTTKTGTGTTTIYPTWSAFPARNTTEGTTAFPNGIQGRKLRSSGGRILARRGRGLPIETRSVCSVVRDSKLAICPLNEFGSALQNADTDSTIQRSADNVLSADGLSQEPNRRTTASSVVRIWAEEPVVVYDLEIAEAHEFFANGILVHNSTASGGCNTAGVLLARAKNGAYYVEHVVAGQWAPDERNDVMLTTAQRDRARYGRHEPRILVEREGGSSGRDAFLAIVRHLSGFPVFEEAVTGDKVTRAEPWSSQCAARNVWIVDDGTWDVAAYINEHCLFPRATLKDRVDASSGACNYLARITDRASRPPLRSYRIGARKGEFRIVLCGPHDTPALDLPWLRLCLHDPGSPSPADTAQMVSLLATCELSFADLDVSALQSAWNEPVPGYDKPPAELVMNRDHARRLWAFLSRQQKEGVPVLVIADSNDDRSTSVAMAYCHATGRDPQKVVCRLGEDAWKTPEEPPSRHVYETVKLGQSLVL